MNWRLPNQLRWLAQQNLAPAEAGVLIEAAAEIEIWRRREAGEPIGEPPIEEGDKANG